MMSKEKPALVIPPRTTVSQTGSVVTIIFPGESFAENFCKWIQWLDDQTEETKLTVHKKIQSNTVQ